MGEIRDWLDARADEMADLLCALVAIPSENPPGAERDACAAVLAQAMDRLGFEPSFLDGPCVRGSVGDGEGLVYFHGHFDVVPAQDREQFVPRREGGRIIGRGTADMKGGLVSMLYGAAAARDLGLLDGRRIVLHGVCDEETGSTDGSGALQAAGLIDPAALAMLTPEPTGGVVWHGGRGAITLRVEIAGREAHVGHVQLGENAFEHMIAIAAPLARLSRELLERDSMLVVGGQTGAGANFNVVPGSAWFSVDRRFNPDEDLETELTRLTTTIEAAARERGAAVKIDVLQAQPANRTAPDHPAALALARTIGGDPVFELCPGVLDTRWYAQLGIPAFAYGGGRLDVSHGPDEFIAEDAMLRCAEVYARFPSAI
jgi:acetylornithine deacetylase/succinyl-diaminopimelate desuccinylase-like protein